MKLNRILFSLFPRPRTRVTYWHALPLVLFLIAYGVLCIYLEWSRTLFFARRGVFLLMAVAPWIWWMQVAGYSGLTRGRGWIALTVRLCLVGLFVLLMAEPRAVRTKDTLSVIYAVDISDSIGEAATDAALRFVMETAVKKPQKDEAGLIVFGRNAAVELPPRISFPFEAINSRVDRDATDLEQALSLAAAMLPEETLGRIVLISDGTQTEGSANRILDELKSRDIAVDVLPIQYDFEDEVWLERLELPRFVKIGENYEASIVLSSLQEGKGKLVLRENDNVIYEETVEFKAGKSRYVVPISLREPGYYEYVASIEVPRGKDHIRENNTVLNYIFVAGEGRVLLVTDPQGDPRDWKLLAQTLKEGERHVDVKNAFEFPRDALSFLPYDAVIFANVPADAFDTIQLQAVRDAIHDLGTGFMMVGGQNSFGAGGYHRTMIEDALPVSMDVSKKKVLPKGALAIILHTCEFPEGNTWGKRITKQAIKVLGAQDEVGVLAFMRTGEGWVFPLTPAAHFEMMERKINAAEIGDMPSFDNTMSLGLKGLKESDASTKHMIIISDGDPSPATPTLIKDYIDSKVSISMVAVFPHGNVEISKMEAVAAATGGRYYRPTDPNELPSIFIKESKTLKRALFENKTFTPEVGFPSDVLKGIEELPPLHGHVLTTFKSRAKQILVTRAEDDMLDPVLGTWQYGLGKTAAFTSDFSPNWGADWVEWSKFQAFIKQLMIDISRVQKEGHLRLWNYTSGTQGVILVEDFAPEDTFLDVQAQITGPRDKSVTVPLKQVGPRRYQATVPLWGKGRYQVLAIGKAGERNDRAVGGFIVPYSPEYLRFRSNPIELNEIAARTGGNVLTKDTTADSIYLSHRKPKQSSRPVFDWFLIALMALVPLDVAIRRVQIDFALIRSWFTLRQGPSTETMGALLKRKQAVASTFEAQKAEIPLSPQKARPPLVPKPGPKPPAGPTTTSSPPSPPPPDAEAKDGSTTSRLLDRKRRRQQEGGEGEK